MGPGVRGVAPREAQRGPTRATALEPSVSTVDLRPSVSSQRLCCKPGFAPICDPSALVFTPANAILGVVNRRNARAWALLGVFALSACGGRSALPSPDPPCPGRSSDCDGDFSNGCEVDLATDRANCGACGAGCAGGLSCHAGACLAGETLVQIESMISTQFVRTADGRVLVWGNNEYGKGNPRSAEKYILQPELLDAPEPLVDVRPSILTTCARGISGRVWCWGALSVIPSIVPGAWAHDFIMVPGVRDAKVLMVSGEGHCVFDADRRALCWSSNEEDELSTGSGHDVQLPLRAAVEMSTFGGTLVTALPSIAAIEHGAVVAWGAPDTLGRLMTTEPITTMRMPLPVPGLSDPLRVEAGKNSYCASLRDGRVFCWGTEIISFERSPVPFVALEHGPYTKVAANDCLCGLLPEGRVECSHDPPDALAAAWYEDIERDGIADLSCGVGTVCHLTRDQRLFCKGDNSEAQQGNGILDGGVDNMTEVKLPALY